MDDLDLLDYLFIVSVVLSLPLMIISTMAVGKHAADLQYQIARGLNGIRWIQSWINLRIHGNRVMFAVVFFTTSVLGLASVDMVMRTYVGRIGFLIVLACFTASAVLDWMAEAKQLKILLKYEEVNNLPKMRVDLHALNNTMQEYFGVVHFTKKNEFQVKDFERLEDEITILIRGLQHDVHSMDPSYRSSKLEADNHANPTNQD